MPIKLSIEAENVEEFDALLSRFTGGATPANDDSPIVPELADKKPAPRKATKAAAPTQEPDGTPIPPVHTPEPQPTPGGTDAPPAESIPPKQEVEEVAATPAATSPAAEAAAAAGDVTVQQLKDAMADLLKATSASRAMQVLQDVAGCKSLTTGSPSVVELAKDDSTIMGKVLEALQAATTAAA